MGKVIFKAVLMLGIVLGISNYVMYLMTGKTPFSQVPDVSISTPNLSEMMPKGSERAYKWTDANGVVHYSSEPPPEVEAQVMDVDPNTNMIQGLRAEAPKETEAAPAPTPTLPQGNVYNPKNVQKLIEDAKNVQNVLNERYESLEKQ